MSEEGTASIFRSNITNCRSTCAVSPAKWIPFFNDVVHDGMVYTFMQCQGQFRLACDNTASLPHTIWSTFSFKKTPTEKNISTFLQIYHEKHNWNILWHIFTAYRGADKSLARPGRKQTNVSVRIASISFGALPCRKKKNLMTARVSMLLKSHASLKCFRACFLPGRA